jgi:DNA invertase Pin-like site-specific DNA recombinase
MSTSTIKAVAYLRVSGFGQVDGDGFPRQREACDQYADRNGIAIVGEYRDEACSGCTDADAREAFGQMVERIAGNGVRVVLVERADRLARDLIVGETLIATLRKLGVKVIEACSGLDLTDTTDPSRILIRQVLGAVAEFNRREIVGKLAKARRRIRESRGRCEGPATSTRAWRTYEPAEGRRDPDRGRRADPRRKALDALRRGQDRQAIGVTYSASRVTGRGHARRAWPIAMFGKKAC